MNVSTEFHANLSNPCRAQKTPADTRNRRFRNAARKWRLTQTQWQHNITTWILFSLSHPGKYFCLSADLEAAREFKLVIASSTRPKRGEENETRVRKMIYLQSSVVSDFTDTKTASASADSYDSHEH